MRPQLALWTAIAALGLAACDKSESPPADNAKADGLPGMIAQAATEGINPPDRDFTLKNLGLCPMRWELTHTQTPPAWLKIRGATTMTLSSSRNLGPLGSMDPSRPPAVQRKCALRRNSTKSASCT